MIHIRGLEAHEGLGFRVYRFTEKHAWPTIVDKYCTKTADFRRIVNPIPKYNACAS